MLDGFYMTLITITTVGFGEIRPLSNSGRLFTVFLIFGGIAIFTYASTTLVQYFASGELRAMLLERRRRLMLTQLVDHYIVCGFGRVGKHVVAELERQSKQFVIIDSDEATVEQCRQLGYNVISGDGADDNILEQAGIYRARSLITSVSADAQNVFIVLTARSMCPDLIIISRANSDDAEPKLRRAGATQVIVPYAISGRRMVSSADHPEIVDFLDIIMHSPELELWLEEVTLAPGCKLVGKTLRESHLRAETGVNVLYNRLPGQTPQMHPDIDTPMEAGTKLIVLGTRAQLEKLTILVEAPPIEQGEETP